VEEVARQRRAQEGIWLTRSATVWEETALVRRAVMRA
jgi:hypothetical protein